MLGSRSFHHALFVFRAAPGFSAVLAVLAALQAGAVALAMSLSGQVVQELPRAVGHPEAFRTVAVVLGALLAVLAAAPLLDGLSSWLDTVAAGRVLQVYLREVLRLAVLPRGVAHLEAAETADRLADLEAETHHWQFVVGLRGVWGLLRARLAGVAVVVLLAAWHWWLVVPGIVAWTLLSAAENRRSAALFDVVDAGLGEQLRRADYMAGLLTSREAAKEVRLFGLVPWLVDEYRGLWMPAMEALARRRERAGLVLLPALALVAAMTVWGGWVIVGAGLDGDLEVGRCTTLLLALLGLSAFGPKGDAQSSTNRVRLAIDRLRSLRSYVDSLERDAPAGVAGSGPASVELEGARFSYPGSSRRVLNDVSFHIAPGQTVAIVGDNGVGKSTLVKLLCGLYPAEAGSVMVDGTSTWSSRPHVGLIAQDSTRFPLSLFDNIDAGSGWSADHESVDRTVADVDLETVVERSGLGVRLSANYEGGTDLSGGQWQRVALARAMTAVTRGAGLLILDEPTSALDIQSEVALFDRLTTPGQDVTTVLVSHRLAGVRRADRILVLADDGDGAYVAEDGTHDQLMRARGPYWAMFTLQASRFTQGGNQ